MKKLIVLLLFSIFTTHAQTLTLEQCYEKARDNYPLIKKRELIEKSKDFSLENASKGRLPQINIFAQATYQNEVTQIPIANPAISITPLSKDQYKMGAEINQIIYDGGIIGQQKKLAKNQSQAELAKNSSELDQLKLRLNQLYFGILQTQKQIEQTALTRSDVENGLKKAQAQLKNGVILRSHVDVLKAQLIALEQKQIELQTVKQSFLQMLSLFIHENLDENTLLTTPKKLLLRNQNNRAELQIFDAQKQILETQKELIKAKNLPKISAFGQVGYGKPGFNMLKNEFDTFYIGGLRLSIPISGFYTQKNDLALIENQQEEIEIEKENFLFNTEFTTIKNTNELKKLEELITKDEELLPLRENIKKASLAQLENGVITTNDYLREVNELDRVQNQKILHEIQYLLTQYNQKAELNN